MLNLILDEDWQLWWQELLLIFSLRRPWAPVLCAGLAFAATYIQATTIRWTVAGVAVILFLIAGVDVARCLVEPDRGPTNPLRPSPRVPVTPFQVVLAGALGAIYAFLVLGALQPLVFILTGPTWWTLAVIAPATFVIACLVAWRNVRLWAFEGAEYEDLLKERQNEMAEREKLKQMRLPNSYWDRSRQ